MNSKQRESERIRLNIKGWEGRQFCSSSLMSAGEGEMLLCSSLVKGHGYHVFLEPGRSGVSGLLGQGCLSFIAAPVF